jgi:hypothetical protein
MYAICEFSIFGFPLPSSRHPQMTRMIIVTLNSKFSLVGKKKQPKMILQRKNNVLAPRKIKPTRAGSIKKLFLLFFLKKIVHLGSIRKLFLLIFLKKDCPFHVRK